MLCTSDKFEADLSDALEMLDTLLLSCCNNVETEDPVLSTLFAKLSSSSFTFVSKLFLTSVIDWTLSAIRRSTSAFKAVASWVVPVICDCAESSSFLIDV